MMAASHKNLPNLIGIGIVLHIGHIVGNCFKKMMMMPCLAIEIMMILESFEILNNSFFYFSLIPRTVEPI